MDAVCVRAATPLGLARLSGGGSNNIPRVQAALSSPSTEGSTLPRLDQTTTRRFRASARSEQDNTPHREGTMAENPEGDAAGATAARRQRRSKQPVLKWET